MPQEDVPQDDDASQRARLVLSLLQKGIQDRRLLRVLETVPRTLFVPEPLLEHAYSDRALPIACGQTISQPLIVGLMTEQLAVGERHKVLEIGTGSGYQTAILARLARRVYTMDRYRTLVKEADARLAQLRIGNVTSMTADGRLGWPAQAPFDRIMVTAAAEIIPAALIDQLADGGVMIIPVGSQAEDQRLVRVVKTGGEIQQRELIPVRFVPLVAGRAVSM